MADHLLIALDQTDEPENQGLPTVKGPSSLADADEPLVIPRQIGTDVSDRVTPQASSCERVHVLEVRSPDWALQFRPDLFQGVLIEHEPLGETRLAEISRAIEKVPVI
jgi:hypothetical protein